MRLRLHQVCESTICVGRFELSLLLLMDMRLPSTDYAETCTIWPYSELVKPYPMVTS